MQNTIHILLHLFILSCTCNEILVYNCLSGILRFHVHPMRSKSARLKKKRYPAFTRSEYSTLFANHFLYCTCNRCLDKIIE